MGRARVWSFAAAAAGAAVAEAGVAPPGPLPRRAGGPVLREPRPQDHYAFMRGYTGVPLAEFNASRAPQVPRFADLDDATFQQLVRDGSPFVVTDCTKDFGHDAASEFTCKQFADRWPSGNMRAEYTPGQPRLSMGDPMWYSESHPERSNPEHMAKDQKLAGTYSWHVKDKQPDETKREVRQHWRTPYFLRNSFANRKEANESFEFLFSMAGGGTFAHMDDHCGATISMQFRGKKKWRMQSFPRVTHYLDARNFNDEEIYDEKAHVPWMPETELEVGPGECVVFPTGYLHETFLDPAENEHNECFSASTFTFNHPRQVNLYRAYLGSFAMSHYGTEEKCVDSMMTYATLFSNADFGKRPSASAMREKAKSLMAEIDTDGDRRFTREELYAALCRTPEQRRRLMEQGGFLYSWSKALSKDEEAELEKEAMDIWTEDAVQYHDIDKDRLVSLEELAQSLLQWNVVQYRLRAMKVSSKHRREPEEWLEKVLRQERAMLSQHYCEPGEPCPEVEELEEIVEDMRDDESDLKKVSKRVTELFDSWEEPDKKERERDEF